MAKYPNIYLAVDNCFAIKRWTKPEEWARIIKEEIGDIECVQASTDLEIDPQFCPLDYRDEWIGEVKKCEQKYGIRIVSFYSGYVTYRSVSLLNWNKGYRDRFRDNYVFGTIDMAKEFNAAVGGSLQAFSEDVLQSPEKFEKAEALLMDYSAQCAKYAQKEGVSYGFEQMYTPTQGWWKIGDVKRYMKDVYGVSEAPLYTTIDTAHMAGQKYFLQPTVKQFESMLTSQSTEGFRLPDEMKRLIETGADIKKLVKTAQKYAYWFSEPDDAKLYRWVEELSCYSPIMHIQQTDGSYSAHRPFTKKYNLNGIVNPTDLLKAIVKCYDRPQEKGMPPRAGDIYLAFEIFFGVTDSTEDVLQAMHETVSFWRNVIREDGKPADHWL